MKLSALISALVVTACGQPNRGSELNATRSQPTSLCEAYAKSVEASEGVKAFKITNPSKNKVSDMELGMIQLAVLLADPTAIAPQAALGVFTDKENGGSLGGDISYSKIKVKNEEQVLAKVVYYPGDNEYGALFRIWTLSDGSQSAALVGNIGDSDIYCHQYTN